MKWGFGLLISHVLHLGYCGERRLVLASKVVVVKYCLKWCLSVVLNQRLVTAHSNRKLIHQFSPSQFVLLQGTLTTNSLEIHHEWMGTLEMWQNDKPIVEQSQYATTLDLNTCFVSTTVETLPIVTEECFGKPTCKRG